MPTRIAGLFFLIVTPLATIAEEADTNGFIPLFDGKTLDGWEVKGGKATYEAVDGAIVGTSKPNTPNTFLCTKNEYGDFVLTYEFKCSNELNSGVQIRSHCFDEAIEREIDGKKFKHPAGRVHGYQVEIDPEKPERSWFAGIYDEARRGWLYPGIKGGDGEKFTRQGVEIYKRGDWNQVRIRCEGEHIRTWLNGEPRADFKDNADARGFIGLQVHGVGGKQKPLKVSWRNLRIRELD